MKFKQTKVATALAYALGVGGVALLTAAPASAADIKVEVTGSNIKRVDGEGVAPVQTITRQDIERQGVISTQDLVDRLSANMSFNNYAESLALGDAGQPGYSGASLRGLGYSRTLVLLNGRRLANFAFNGAGVDLNSIPIAAIERVEILKDGASAIYGTDAIAGVMNFITRKDYQGVDLFAYYGDSEQGGGSMQHYNVSAGWGDLTKDKFNIWGSVDYQKFDGLKAAERSFSSTAYRPDLGVNRTSGNAFPGNIGGITKPDGSPVSGTRNPTNPQCSPPVSFPTPGSGATQCRFDYASVIDIIDPSTRLNAIGRLTWQINPDHQFFLEGNYSHNEFTFRISPTPISNATTFNGDPFLLRPSSAFYPTNFINSLGGDTTKPVNVLWRSLELGPRTNEPETDQWRFVAGFQGVVKGWDYAVAYTYNESKTKDVYTDGWLNESIILPILNSGRVNPFAANTPEINALMSTAKIQQEVRNGKGITQSVDAKVSNEIYQMPAGPLAMALGAEFRRESLEQNSSSILSSGDLLGGGGNIPTIPEKTRRVFAMFAEFSIPIVKTLEAQVAVRYDDYSDFGSTTNPKIGLRWQPSKNVLLRGTWGTGFRAPSLQDLYQPLSQSNTAGAWDDPERCPVTKSANDCDIQFNTRQGGNPALGPEKSTQWTVGGVWEPVDNMSIGLDYWWIEIKDTIVTLSDSTVFGNFAQYAPTNIFRGPKDPQYPNLPGPIAYVYLPLFNIGKTQTDGIDLDVNFRFPQTSIGQFTAQYQGTYVIDYKQSNSDGSLTNYVGTGGAPVGVIPRYKHNLMLAWAYGAWGANVNQVFQQGYTEPAPGLPAGERQVGSYSIWGAQGTYSGLKNTVFTAGVRNLFDRDPPASAQNYTFQVGFDPTYTDPRGRFWYGSIRYSFR